MVGLTRPPVPGPQLSTLLSFDLVLTVCLARLGVSLTGSAGLAWQYVLKLVIFCFFFVYIISICTNSLSELQSSAQILQCAVHQSSVRVTAHSNLENPSADFTLVAISGLMASASAMAVDSSSNDIEAMLDMRALSGNSVQDPCDLAESPSVNASIQLSSWLECQVNGIY
jgi:hypothetical protein